MEAAPATLIGSFALSSQKRHGYINPKLWRWRYKSATTNERTFVNQHWIPRTTPENAAWQHQYETAHEREAFENFATYATDREAEEKPYFKVATDNLEDLPPMARLTALKSMIQDRDQIRGASLDKCKLLLKALECYEDLQKSGRMPGNKIHSLEDDYVDEFEHFAEAVLVSAEKTVFKHPDVVSAMLRTAEICDACGHEAYRDRALERAEMATGLMDSAFPHKVPAERQNRLNSIGMIRQMEYGLRGDYCLARNMSQTRSQRTVTYTNNNRYSNDIIRPRYDRMSPQDDKLTVANMPYPRSALQLPRYLRFKVSTNHVDSEARMPDAAQVRGEHPFTPGESIYEDSTPLTP